ncbi:MAG: hypothetical protein J6W81_05360 [Lentisphaeria bacterium]|nr:hypothetical protein [Lentisphaeria bacterium]
MREGNPIFTREFLSVSRAWKTRIIIALYLVILALLLIILWPSGGVQSVVTEGAKKIFSMFFSVNLALLLLMIPAFAAGSITTERERGTYPALFTTLLTSFDIMTGKLASAALMIIIMTVLSMPVAAICALAGGVDVLFMSKIMALLLATALSYGLIGLACSSVCRRTTGAILLNYVLVLLLAGATWLPSALLSNLLPEFNGIFQTIRSISPFDAIGYLLYPDTYKLTMNVELSSSFFNPFVTYLIAAAVISLISLIIFHCNVLHPEIKSRKHNGDIYNDTKKAIKRKLTFPFYLLDPLKRKKPIGRFSNPVFVAEMRSKLFSNPNFVIRTVSCIFILSLVLLTLLSFQMGEEIKAGSVRMVAIVFQIGIVALLAPGVSSGLITDEITGNTFTALRMTPISPLTLIFGKLKATFFYALIFLVSSIFILLAMAYLEPAVCFPETSVLDPAFFPDLWQKIQSEPDWFNKFFQTYRPIWIWIIILLLSTTTFLSTGLVCSAFAKNTPSATAAAYAITGFICIVTLIPIPLKEKFTPGLSAFLFSFNPIVSAMQATSNAFEEYPSLWINNIVTMIALNVIFLILAVIRVYRLYRQQN